MRSFFAAGSLALVAGLFVCGCTKTPDRVMPPTLDPAAAAQAALQAYDANHDGAIDEKELVKSPALADGLEKIDTDHDHRISADELVARMKSWQDSKIGIKSYMLQINQGGAPLADAEVKLIPEAFLGPAFAKASGKSGSNGMVSLSSEGAKHPGVQLGFYRVEITGKQALPAKYNTDSELGVEVAQDNPPIMRVLELKK